MRHDTGIRDYSVANLEAQAYLRIYDVPMYLKAKVLRPGLGNSLLTPKVGKNNVIEIPLIIVNSFDEVTEHARWLLLYQAARAFSVFRHHPFADRDKHLFDIKKTVAGLKNSEMFKTDRVMRMYHDFIMLVGETQYFTEEFESPYHAEYYMGRFQYPYMKSLGEFIEELLRTPARVMHALGPVVPDIVLSNPVTKNIEHFHVRRFACAKEDDAIICSVLSD